MCFYNTKYYNFRNLKPVESALVSFLSQGEGWHNYHHAFPWDYRAAELGSRYSMTTFIINFLASVGLAYDLRTTPHNIVEHRVLRTGDGTHPIHEQADPSITKAQSLEHSTDINGGAPQGINNNDGLVKRAAIAVQG